METTDPAPTPPDESIHRKYQRRIQDAIFRLSERARSGERHILDVFIKHVSPQMRRNGDSELPVPLRRAALDPERSSGFVMPGLLYFHIANAIVTYYDLINGVGTDTAELLERRIAFIENIATKGVKEFKVIGTDMAGFTLIARDEAPVKFLTPKQGEQQPDPDEQDDDE